MNNIQKSIEFHDINLFMKTYVANNICPKLMTVKKKPVLKQYNLQQ